MLNNKAVLAHISLRELAILDDLQGERITDKKTKLPEYFKLAHKLVINPNLEEEIEDRFHHSSREMSKMPHLSGGLEHIAHQGINGDRTLAIIPEHLAKILDHVVGGPRFNHKTGLREYFLPLLLSGLSMLAGPAMDFLGKIFTPQPSFTTSPQVAIRGLSPKLARRVARDHDQRTLAAVQARMNPRRFAKLTGLSAPSPAATQQPAIPMSVSPPVSRDYSSYNQQASMAQGGYGADGYSSQNNNPSYYGSSNDDYGGSYPSASQPGYGTPDDEPQY